MKAEQRTGGTGETSRMHRSKKQQTTRQRVELNQRGEDVQVRDSGDEAAMMRLMRDRCGGAQEGNRAGEQEVTVTLRWFIKHDHGGAT